MLRFLAWLPLFVLLRSVLVLLLTTMCLFNPIYLLQTQLKSLTNLVLKLQIVELPNHPFFIGAQFHPEYKSRPGKASPLFIGLIAASCGELDTVMNQASVHQHLISNGPKNVFVSGTSKKAPNGLADVRYNNGYCNGLYTR